VEQRAYVAFYRAEQIINWRVERVRGRNVPTLVVLRERGERSEVGDQRSEKDEFESDLVEQIRVLRLVPERHLSPTPIGANLV